MRGIVPIAADPKKVDGGIPEWLLVVVVAGRLHSSSRSSAAAAVVLLARNDDDFGAGGGTEDIGADFMPEDGDNKSTVGCCTKSPKSAKSSLLLFTPMERPSKLNPASGVDGG